jgi:hypothetical protein
VSPSRACSNPIFCAWRMMRNQRRSEREPRRTAVPLPANRAHSQVEGRFYPLLSGGVLRVSQPTPASVGGDLKAVLSSRPYVPLWAGLGSVVGAAMRYIRRATDRWHCQPTASPHHQDMCVSAIVRSETVTTTTPTCLRLLHAAGGLTLTQRQTQRTLLNRPSRHLQPADTSWVLTVDGDRPLRLTSLPQIPQHAPLRLRQPSHRAPPSRQVSSRVLR